MSVQSFDRDKTYFTATFTIRHPDGSLDKVSYGVWEKEKNPKSYIKQTFNHQYKLEEWVRSGGQRQPGGAYGRTRGYPRPINDASTWLTWYAKDSRYISAEVEPILFGEGVAGTKVEYNG